MYSAGSGRSDGFATRETKVRGEVFSRTDKTIPFDKSGHCRYGERHYDPKYRQRDQKLEQRDTGRVSIFHDRDSRLIAFGRVIIADVAIYTSHRIKRWSKDVSEGCKGFMQWLARGFSLIEIIIVLGLVALLAVLAVPTYQRHMMSVRRADAITTLLSIHTMQERWRTNDADYATLAELGWQGNSSRDGYYHLEMTRSTPERFRLTATPNADGAQADDVCGVFLITQDGPQYGRSFANRRCWRR
jgi:type IV pilus assembly protein PilE